MDKNKTKIRTGFRTKKFYCVNCSKCNVPFTTDDGIAYEVYLTKAELITAMKDFDWHIKGNEVICNDCFE